MAFAEPAAGVGDREFEVRDLPSKSVYVSLTPSDIISCMRSYLVVHSEFMLLILEKSTIRNNLPILRDISVAHIKMASRLY